MSHRVWRRGRICHTVQGGEAMTEPDQLTLHPSVPPGGIVPRHANHQLVDRRRSRGTSRPAACGVVPRARNQSAMPSQDRGSSHRENRHPAAAPDKPGQGGQPHPVGRRVAHPGVWVPNCSSRAVTCGIAGQLPWGMIVDRGGTTVVSDLLAGPGLAGTAGPQRTIKERRDPRAAP